MKMTKRIFSRCSTPMNNDSPLLEGPKATASAGATQRLHLFITGRVKRVRFRLFVKRQAEALGLVGWVRNRRSDRVEVLAEGPKPSLDSLYRAVKKGPPEAKVAAVEVRWDKPQGRLRGFRIRWIGFL